MKKLVILTFFALVFSLQDASAQGASVTFDEPEGIEILFAKHRAFRLRNSNVSGYRIQVYSKNDRQEALDIRATLLQRYPNLSVYLIYKQPTYRVRVGDFISRAEAANLSKELKSLYPITFVVPDTIDPFPPLDDK